MGQYNYTMRNLQGLQDPRMFHTRKCNIFFLHKSQSCNVVFVKKIFKFAILSCKRTKGLLLRRSLSRQIDLRPSSNVELFIKRMQFKQ